MRPRYTPDNGPDDDAVAPEGLGALLHLFHDLNDPAPEPAVHPLDREFYPALHERQVRERDDWNRRVLLAEAVIAAGCRYTNTHTADITGWQHLLDIGAEQARREYGECERFAPVLAEAAVRQWRVIAASRADAMRRAA